MIIRIVRMNFRPENIKAFLDIFNDSKSYIIESKGCLHVELWQDLTESHVFVTHSHWESEEALNEYRNSQFFREIWKKTKNLFKEKPMAFSVKRFETDTIISEISG